MINRILEKAGNIFAICKKSMVKDGNINNVKTILMVNIFGNGLTGNSYKCLLTKNRSAYVPIKEEKIIAVIVAIKAW